MRHCAWLLVLVFSVPVQAEEFIRFVSKETQDYYASFMPETDDPWFENIKKRVAFYDKESMPDAYQFNGGVHSPLYNISAVKPAEQFGNANIEFPWGEPGGIARSPNAKSIKFVHLPGGENGHIRYYNRGGLISWTYPVGTVFGEILVVKDPNGKEWPFETRIRHLEETGWRMESYRPFASPQELANKVKFMEPAWKAKPELRKFIENLEKAKDLRVETLTDANMHPTGKAFESTAVVEELAPLPPGLVRKLLRSTFKPVSGRVWRKLDRKLGYAPTTKAEFHIVPKDYDGAFIPITLAGCMKCHDSVQKHVHEFHFGRDWYGHVRGSHRIFSFHIFDPSCISYNGFIQGIVFNQKMVQSGLLRQGD